MKRYRKFTKGQFEWNLRNMQVGWMEDITEQWLSEGKHTWERIYRISTKNKAVDIIIFSSVDMRTNKVRDHGDDRVRVVLRWKTKNGYVFKKIHHHNRIDTLFQNLQKTLTDVQQQVFQLNYKEFTKEAI